MTQIEKDDKLNSYYGIIAECKYFLHDTDWQMHRELDGDKPMSQEIKTKRIEARAKVNEYEEYIKQLIDEPVDPEIHEDMGMQIPEGESVVE